MMKVSLEDDGMTCERRFCDFLFYFGFGFYKF